MKGIGAVLALLLLLPACVKPVKRQKLLKIELGMTKDQINKILGQPKLLRGSIINRDRQIVEVFEYDVDTGKSSSQIWSNIGYAFLAAFCNVWIFAQGSDSHIKPFWFFFHNNVLVKWGGAGDWQQEMYIVHEMKFL